MVFFHVKMWSKLMQATVKKSGSFLGNNTHLGCSKFLLDVYSTYQKIAAERLAFGLVYIQSFF